MTKKVTIGVLALQGDFERHLEQLKELNIRGCEIRRSDQLEKIDGLIIPGGESTTMTELIDRFNMRRTLVEFCSQKPVWGTCAGMIMLAREVDHDLVRPLNIIDITVKRNGYGRQVHSFFTTVQASLNGHLSELKASFIRAPMVSRYAPGISVLATYGGSPVLLTHKNCLVSSFHTELESDLTLIDFFVRKFVTTAVSV
ncbi:MAG: pyridoxal 5'-phosphate synthase glutaminase subunit PdxT [Candidatus Zixiibacteriota bacterium]